MGFKQISFRTRSFGKCLAGILTAIGAMGVCQAEPGDLDANFNPMPNSVVRAVSVLPDGSIVFGGDFTVLGNSVAVSRLAKVSASGNLNFGFNPAPNSSVTALTVMQNNTVYVGGMFTLMGTVPRIRMARISDAGGLDNTFNPGTAFSTGPYVGAMTPQLFGGLVFVGGPFGLYKVQQNGNLVSSSSFTPFTYSSANPGVTNIIVQNDNRVLIGGMFGANGDLTDEVESSFSERLLENGEADTPYVSDIYGGVTAQAVQANGRILIGGDFSLVGGKSKPYLARLNSTGGLDTTFNPRVDGPIRAIVVQADGKILVGGEFNRVNDVVWPRLARLYPNGDLDTDFDAHFALNSGAVQGITLQADGRVIVNGTFTFINGVQRTSIARLESDAATSDFRATSPTRIQWLRGGTSPEAETVTFEYTTSGAWQSLGYASRIEGGWEINGIPPLPASCQLRAFARTKGGNAGGSASLLTVTQSYPIPLMTVADAEGGVVENDGTYELGLIGSDVAEDFTFFISNTGTGSLTDITAEFTGVNPDLFSISSGLDSPVTAPDGAMPFTVNVAPGELGTQTATLVLRSNGASTPAYQIQLSVEIVDPKQAWLWKYFQVTEPEGEAADDFDADQDGHTNEFEFVAGLDPTDPASKFSFAAETIDGVAKVKFSPVFAGRSYTVESNDTLESEGWISTTGTTEDVENERIFTDSEAAEGRKFYRVLITRP